MSHMSQTFFSDVYTGRSQERNWTQVWIFRLKLCGYRLYVSSVGRTPLDNILCYFCTPSERPNSVASE